MLWFLFLFQPPVRYRLSSPRLRRFEGHWTAVFARACILRLEALEVLAGDTAPLGELSLPFNRSRRI